MKENNDNTNSEETEDERFLRTGIASFKLDVNIQVTYEDMLKDLVKKTEGSNIDIEPISEN